MSAGAARDLISRYYTAFNAQDMGTFLSLLTEDVVHDINQGGREVGREQFARFMQRMNRNYRERVVDLVIMTSEEGKRAAAEFTVLGTYLVTGEGLPPDLEGLRQVRSQGQVLNARDWMRQPLALSGPVQAVPL